MPLEAPSLTDLNRLVQPSEFPDTSFPKPKRITVSETTDSDGEDAYAVQVVFPDRTTDSELDWSRIEGLVTWIRRTIWNEGGNRRWPYVWVRRESEWDPVCQP